MEANDYVPELRMYALPTSTRAPLTLLWNYSANMVSYSHRVLRV